MSHSPARQREAIYPPPSASQLHSQHPIYSYLPRKMQNDRPHQVWRANITFAPVRNGFRYLVSITDRTYRKVLSWRLSNTTHADFCIDPLNVAITRHRPSEIVNPDQGGQLTGSAWITTLIEAGGGALFDECGFLSLVAPRLRVLSRYFSSYSVVIAANTVARCFSGGLERSKGSEALAIAAVANPN